MPDFFPDKKPCRTWKPILSQDELWFLFEAGKFFRDLADAAEKVPNEVLREYGAHQLTSDPQVIYEFGMELEDLARRCIAKEYNKKKKERKKQKKNPKPMPTMEDFGFTAEEAL
jgi:hypothetical protein